MHTCKTLAIVAWWGLTAALPNSDGSVQSRGETDTYDYVIVGGGVTGLVVANRLTEDETSKHTPEPFFR